MFEIEPGKFYKTRRGDKARIYDASGTENENSCFFWHGAILCSDRPEFWSYCGWDKFGRASYAVNKPEDGDDIVAEW